MKNRIVRVLVYILWGLFSLLVCIYWTFPTDTLALIIRAQIDQRVGHRYLVRLDEVSLAGLTGIKLTNFWLTPIRQTDQTAESATSAPYHQQADREGSGEPAAPVGTDPPPLVFPNRIDHATVTVGLLSLLRNDPEVSFEAKIGEGLLYGSWKRHPTITEGHQLSVSADGVPLNALGLISQAAQAAVTGTLTGHLTLSYNAENRLHEGELQFLQIDDLVRQAGPIDVGSVSIPLITPTRFGQIHAQAVLDGPELTINRFDAMGGDLEVTVPSGGRLTMRTPFGQSFLRMTLQLRLQEEWMLTNEMDGLLRNIRLLREACEGYECAVAITGPVAQIQAQPLRSRQGY
ncbi:MAG: type II secretion system protein GspN [Bradymonadales bacterium]|nr:type II secretion system protein GspN [Bradymonadales bacterium]